MKTKYLAIYIQNKAIGSHDCNKVSEARSILNAKSKNPNIICIAIIDAETKKVAQYNKKLDKLYCRQILREFAERERK
mgnify:CR=1 FL=1